MDMDEAVMSLIVNSGSARSSAIEALRFARDGDFDSADKIMAEADTVILESHEAQTQLIQAELNGQHTEVNLLMIHAQDHLMNAMTVMDLCKELVEVLRKKQ